MKLFDQASFLLNITRSHGIVRRYFVVNGFDGALTMLGLILGFLVTGHADITVVISACLGAAIALGISGISSAYISESAERRRALGKLEDAMLSDLQDSAHADATIWVPMLIALVNGLAPLIISLLIITPLWLFRAGVDLPLPPLQAAILMALILIFLLGVFLGRTAGVSWMRSGLQTLLVALVTMMLIYLIAG